MIDSTICSPQVRLTLFGPPYDRFQAIGTQWKPVDLPPMGLAAVWWLVDGHEQQDEFAWLHTRPHGMPLFIVLPPAGELARAMPLLAYVNGLGPRAVLPTSSVVAPLYLRRLLGAAPRDLAGNVTQYLFRRGLLTTDRILHEVEQIFRVVPDITAISKLARRLYTSRRTLGRHFAAAGLPVPSHWLQFARLIHASVQLQAESTTVARVASRVGYPDAFTMSNQMKRMIGHRPSELRTLLGWEWIVEAWIRQEFAGGGFDPVRYYDVIRAYHTGPAST